MSQQPYQPQYPQQGPPQGYPQQQPPPGYPGGPAYDQGQPAGYPPPPPQGAPSPFNQAAPSGPPAASGKAWNNPDVPQGGGGEAPAFHQLEGRLCFFKPTTSVPESPKNSKFVKPGESATEHLVTSEVVVLDGPPIAGNLDGNTQQLTPFSAGPRQMPTYFKQIYIRGAVAPGQLHKYAGGGLVLGRVIRGQAGSQGRPPLVIQDPTPEDDAIASQVYPMWDQLVQQAAGTIQQAPPVQPQQFAQPPTQGAYNQPYPQQGAPAGYPQAPGQPYQPQQPYPGQPQGGYPQAPGWPQPGPEGPPPGWPQQGYPGPTH